MKVVNNRTDGAEPREWQTRFCNFMQRFAGAGMAEEMANFSM